MSREFMREFIELYQSQPCLWKTKSKDYLDKNKKNEAYNILIEKLKTVQPSATNGTVINKINTLRGGFRREYKKVQSSKRTGTGSDDIYVPSLWYYDLLLFVRDQDNPRDSVSNIDGDGEDIIEDQSQNEEGGDFVDSDKEVRFLTILLF